MIDLLIDSFCHAGLFTFRLDRSARTPTAPGRYLSNAHRTTQLGSS